MSFQNTASFGTPAVHWTANQVGDAPKRTKVACGKRGRKSYAMVHSTAQTVTCQDCLALQAN